jgi:predicted nucleic acid-binding protein
VTKPSLYLLDSSAILSLFESEPGAKRVGELLNHHRCLIPWPVCMEVFYRSMAKKGEFEAYSRLAYLKNAPGVQQFHLTMTEPHIIQAGKLKAKYDLSFADAVIAAYALLNHATLVHKDPEYDILPPEIKQEKLPYKLKSHR